MRLSLLLIMFFGLQGLQAQSPSYVDFEWDVLRFGYVAPSGGEVSGGFAFGGELRYNATDNFSIGIGGDGALFGDNLGEDGDFGVAASSLLFGDFYFSSTSATRPFVGIGMGRYRTGTLTIVNGNVEEVIDGISGFGFAPRVGYEFGHVRLLGQYNITTKEGMSNYFGITVGLTLWGGYKGDSYTPNSNSKRNALD